MKEIRIRQVSKGYIISTGPNSQEVEKDLSGVLEIVAKFFKNEKPYHHRRVFPYQQIDDGKRYDKGQP